LKKMLFAAMIIISLAAALSGCVGGSTMPGTNHTAYTTELNDGNAAFSQANGHYNSATDSYNIRIYYQATAEMGLARDDYYNASVYYDKMLSHSDTYDQQMYAGALNSESVNCMYASDAFIDAYNYYAQDDTVKGNLRLADANNYVNQAKTYYDQAALYEQKAMQ
jgi:hypothetical protein